MCVLGPDRPRVADRIGLAGEEPLHVAGGDVQLTQEDRHHRGVVLAEPVSRQGEALDDRWVVAAVVREIGVVLELVRVAQRSLDGGGDVVRVGLRRVLDDLLQQLLGLRPHGIGRYGVLPVQGHDILRVLGPGRAQLLLGHAALGFRGIDERRDRVGVTADVAVDPGQESAIGRQVEADR